MEFVGGQVSDIIGSHQMVFRDPRVVLPHLETSNVLVQMVGSQMPNMRSVILVVQMN